MMDTSDTTKKMGLGLMLCLGFAAQPVMAEEYLEQKSTKQTEFEKLLELAEVGDPVAQTKVGDSYAARFADNQAFATAIYWYAQAAGSEYIPAQLKLAEMYALGKGVPKNDAYSDYWKRHAKAISDGTLKPYPVPENGSGPRDKPVPGLPFLQGPNDKGGCTPQWPRAALRYEQEGTVGMRFSYAPNGSLVDARIIKSSGWPELDSATFNTLVSCNYGVHVAGVKPLPASYRVNFVWKLGDNEAVKTSDIVTGPGKSGTLTALEKADIAYSKGDYASAVKEYRTLAEQGDSVAQYDLGTMYLAGRGVPQDKAEAMRWFEKAAALGQVAAQFNLAEDIRVNRKVEEGGGIQQAFPWYLKAAERGQSLAQCYVGIVYQAGQGVPQNLPLAVQWFKKAAAQGENCAIERMAGMHISGQGLERSDAQGVALYQVAAQNGSPLAQWFIGARYYLGQGLPQDFAKAKKFFMKAAIQGNSSALGLLGEMYRSGAGADRNKYLAYIYFSLEALNASTQKAQDKASAERDTLFGMLESKDILRADAVIKAWRPGKALPSE